MMVIGELNSPRLPKKCPPGNTKKHGSWSSTFILVDRQWQLPSTWVSDRCFCESHVLGRCDSLSSCLRAVGVGRWGEESWLGTQSTNPWLRNYDFLHEILGEGGMVLPLSLPLSLGFDLHGAVHHKPPQLRQLGWSLGSGITHLDACVYVFFCTRKMKQARPR